LSKIKLSALPPSIILAALLTFAGFLAIADVHQAIPIIQQFLWITAPIVFVGDIFGMLTNDAAYWVALILGFVLWVFLFALLLSPIGGQIGGQALSNLYRKAGTEISNLRTTGSCLDVRTNAPSLTLPTDFRRTCMHCTRRSDTPAERSRPARSAPGGIAPFRDRIPYSIDGDGSRRSSIHGLVNPGELRLVVDVCRAMSGHGRVYREPAVKSDCL
jgi:hypothetical protein